MALLLTWSAMVGRFIEPQNFSSLVCPLSFLLAKLNSRFFSDALSLTYLTHIHNKENSRLILEHLKTDEFVKSDYSDCLRPEYTIPGLILSLLNACSITANKPSYDFLSVSKDNTDELELMKYAPPLVTPRIRCQSQPRAYTKFMLLPRTSLSLQTMLISRSQYQVPFKEMVGV